MKHISNIYDPEKTDAQLNFLYTSLDYHQRPKEWERYLEWAAKFIVGRPQATEFYTVAQLEGWGMVGLYALEDGDERS